jgi:small subunit ribosomal protein S20
MVFRHGCARGFGPRTHVHSPILIRRPRRGSFHEIALGAGTRTDMANIASQKKRIARSSRERMENLRFASAVKTQMKRLEDAVASGDDGAADAEHKALISRVDKAVQRGALHRNTGARKKARAARIRAGSS